MSKTKRIISILLSLAMLISVFAVIETATASAATAGTWKLVSSRSNVPDNSEDGYYKYKYDYSSIFGEDFITLKASGGFYNPDSMGSDSLADYYFQCSRPKSSYKAGEKASVTMRLYTKNSTATHYNESCRTTLDAPNIKQHYYSPKYGFFTDKNDKSGLVERDGYTYSEGNTDVNMTVSKSFPENPENGDQATIYFIASKTGNSGNHLFYEWNYKFSKSSSTNSAKKTVKKPAATEFTKVSAKGNKVNVKWEKIIGVKGYNLQWSTSKKFKKKSNVFTKKTKGSLINGKKGKRYYFRVRTYKLNGKKKVYSKWSKVKSAKIKVKKKSKSTKFKA